MEVIRSRVEQCNGREADAMRPRVVHVEVYILTSADPGIQQKSVVTRRAAIVILSQITEVRLWIHKIQQTALIHVCSRRADRIRHRSNRGIERARPETKEQCRIQFECIPDVRKVRPDVSSPDEPGRRHLSLYTEVP